LARCAADVKKSSLRADSTDRELADNGRTHVALLPTQPRKTGAAAAAAAAAGVEGQRGGRPPVLDAATGMLASDGRRADGTSVQLGHSSVNCSRQLLRLVQNRRRVIAPVKTLLYLVMVTAIVYSSLLIIR